LAEPEALAGTNPVPIDSAERELRLEQALLESLKEAALDGILVVSSEGRIVSFNRRFVEMWAIPDEVMETRSDSAALASISELVADPGEFLARVEYLYDHPDERSHDEVSVADGRVIDRYSAPVDDRDGRHHGRVWFFRDVSAERRAESELRESRDQLAVILREVADGITVLDPSGRIIFANAAAARQIGFSSVEELIETPVPEILARFEVLDVDRRPLPVEELPSRAALRGERGERTVCYRVVATGAERWSVVRATPVVDDAGRVQFAITLFRDVTERRRSEERLSFLANASNLLSSSLDYETTLANVPRLAVPTLADWCVVDRFEPDGTVRRVGAAHVDPAKAELLRAVEPPRGYRRVVADGQALLLTEVDETRLREAARDEAHLEQLRELRPSALICVPLVARGRTLGAITLAASETTPAYGAEELALAEELGRRAALAVDNALLYREAQQSARRLEESFALLDALLSSAPVGVGFWDRDLRYVRVNEKLAELNGIPAEDHVGKSLREVTSELAPRLEPLYRRVLATGEPQEHQESTSADSARPGAERHWLSSYYPVKTPAGETIGVGAVVTEVTERRRAEQERAARARQQAAVAALGQLALADVELDVLFETAVSRVAETLGVEHAGLFERVADGSALRLRAGVGWRDGLVGSATVPVEDGQVGYTLRSAEPVVVEHLPSETRFTGPPLLQEHGVVGGVSVLVGGRDEAFGVLAGNTSAWREFTEDDVNFLTAVANVVAAAIERCRADAERAHLLEAEQRARKGAERSAETLRRLHAVTEVTLSYLRLEPLLDELLTRIADLLGVDTTAVLLLEEERGEVVAWAAKGLEEEVEQGVRIPVGQGFAGRIVAERRAIVIEDLDQAEVLNPLLREKGLKSLLGVPLRLEDRVVGVLHVGSLESRRFTEEDRTLLQLIGDRVALALEQARLYEAERSARAAAEAAERRVGFLAEASRMLAGSLDYETTLRNVAELAGTTIADWMSVYLLADDGSSTTIVNSHRESGKNAVAEELARRYPPTVTPGTPQAQVLHEGRSLLFREIPREMLEAAAEDDEHLRMIEALGLESAVLVPISAGGRTLGSLTFVLDEGSRRYDEDDLALAEEIGRRVGLAVENARLLAREQEARRQAEHRAEAAQALEFVADGVLLVDADGVVRLWNPAAEAMTGIEAASLVGRRADEAIAGWRELRERVPTARAQRDGLGARPETLPLELGGRELWLSISAVEFDAGTVFAFRDVTEEHGVEKLKRDFVSTVSHELRTPLAAIYGAALTLRRGDLPLEHGLRENLLAVIADEAERLARIVNDILWTSRIETDAVQITIESCDPAELVRGVVQAARLHAPEAIAIELEVGDAPLVAADRDKVRQVLGNLVENAVKYSPGGGTVAVRVEGDERTVRFRVRDEGLGIPAGEHERIFEKFYRLDPDLTQGIGGTGLGLYICRELVRRMRGRIWVDSAPGRGSTFVVELPAVGDPVLG
jgi:PAS domain S-box-containing protein